MMEKNVTISETSLQLGSLDVGHIT